MSTSRTTSTPLPGAPDLEAPPTFYVLGLSCRLAGVEDAPAIAAVENEASRALTEQFGRGHWSAKVSERSVLRAIGTSNVLVATDATDIVGTLRLGAKKPWAIDTSYFTIVTRPLYLQNMTVSPERQRQGLGRLLIECAASVATHLGAEAIRLDAYDAPAGAGDFYRKCGYAEVGRASYRGTPLVYFELVL